MNTPFQSVSRLLCFWTPDAHGAESEAKAIASQLGHFGYEFSVCDNLDLLLQAGNAEQAPLAVLLDFAHVDTLSETQRQQLRQLTSQTPVIALSEKGDITRRLAAARIGCQAFFTQPLNFGNLLDTLDRLVAPARADAGKVLIIEDSTSLASLYAATLAEAGFVCHFVTDPLKSLDALDEHRPELILLDMHMPGANGEELARVIRQQDAYLSVPIVFLSGESDISRQREAMSLGGDEFLQKPIEPEHLVSAVRARIIRYRNLRSLMLRDSLTGLLNHTSFKERLRGEVARVKRLKASMSVALLDIDHFKKVNDTYGHPAGDRVIKSLARLLRQRLRTSDVIGRYGGEEFAVALPNTPLADGTRVLEHIRSSFANLVHHVGNQTFHCTLSAGIVECNEFTEAAGWDTEVLIQNADDALYTAKANGRNKVMSGQCARQQPN